MKYFELSVAGLIRELPIIKIKPGLSIASFVILGDCEMVSAAAPFIADRLPEIDYIMTAEAKGIPLVNEVCRILGHPRYIVARKSVKTYMDDPLEIEVESITTQRVQRLYLDNKDTEMIKGKRVAILDDVISSGESLKALEELAKKAGAVVVAKAAILAEGDAADRDDIIYLEKLPLFYD